MPTTIKLSTMTGTKEIGAHYTTLSINLFSPALAVEQITITRTDEIAAAVRAFGERVREAHPDASFKVLVQVPKGQRKPPGFDAADKAGAFGETAFMHVVEDRRAAFATLTPTPTAAPDTANGEQHRTWRRH